MLNIYYGSETADKAKFIFEHIKGRTLLLVPDQFSLQTEKDAFFYLGERSLIDLMIVDFSSLGHKVVAEAGGRIPAMIDKYGRHMLLSGIMDNMEDELEVFKGINGRNSFIDMMNSLISEMKRYEVTPEALLSVVGELDDRNYLKYKLRDVEKIYSAYQSAIEGKYLDSEDYISFYGEKIMKSRLVAGADVWIYGFDTFTPKNILIIERLLKTAASVNVVMTYENSHTGGSQRKFCDGRFLAADDEEELFGLTKYVIGQLSKAAEELNEEVNIEFIEGNCRKSVWNSGEEQPFITLARTSNIYTEAERAAAFILELVKERGYRFQDIVVLCNDYEVRGGVLRRTFLRWGIPVFMDRKRKVMHHPAVGFVLALMETITGSYRDDAVMRIVKSGLMDFSSDEAELLENYVEEFNIRGTMWKKEFTRCGRKYTDEDLNILNELRSKIVYIIEQAKQETGVRNKVEEKIRGLYRFLEEDFSIRERLEIIMERQKAAGLTEGAAETAQSWNVICNIFDQIIETLGEERISNEKLLKLMVAGFEEIEIGLVPTNPDCVIIGTMQRTRLNRVKVLLVTGANEGILPMAMQDDGLLSDREKEILENHDLELSKRDAVARQEERLAIYRALSLPQEQLYMSCSMADEKGEELRASNVFVSLEEYAEKCGLPEPLSDLGAKGNFSEMLVSGAGTLSYVADALRRYYSEGSIEEEWFPVIRWYSDKDPEDLDRVRCGILFDNNLEMLGETFADALYRGEKAALEVSASRLEGYSRCPFAHFVKYGLRAEDVDRYVMGAGEIGDVYHECLMRFSKGLMPDRDKGLKVCDDGSPWMSITKEQCGEEIRRILEEDMADFREGILSFSSEERYRTDRIAEICSGIAWTMVKQVRKGAVSEMYFEQPFGSGRRLPAVRVDVGGKDVLIQGKIDRLDVIETEKGESARVVDYKTGNEVLNIDYLRSGYKLQLMVYLKAVNKEPAGVFYFKIKDVDIDADVKKTEHGEDALEERMADAYRLEGILINDMDIIESMDGEIAGSSQVIPVKLSKKENSYRAAGGGYLFTEEEFKELSEQVDSQVKRICRDICDGNIAIEPKIEKTKDTDGRYRTSCRYCNYKSICMFDTLFAGCRYKHA